MPWDRPRALPSQPSARRRAPLRHCQPRGRTTARARCRRELGQARASAGGSWAIHRAQRRRSQQEQAAQQPHHTPSQEAARRTAEPRPRPRRPTDRQKQQRRGVYIASGGPGARYHDAAAPWPARGQPPPRPRIAGQGAPDRPKPHPPRPECAQRSSKGRPPRECCRRARTRRRRLMASKACGPRARRAAPQPILPRSTQGLGWCRARKPARGQGHPKRGRAPTWPGAATQAQGAKQPEYAAPQRARRPPSRARLRCNCHAAEFSQLSLDLPGAQQAARHDDMRVPRRRRPRSRPRRGAARSCSAGGGPRLAGCEGGRLKPQRQRRGCSEGAVGGGVAFVHPVF